jgi:glycosyltransferase involved in cell wall biosynthesis
MANFFRNGKLIEWDSENPVITCLMSVYNGETYLKKAIDSILDQSYTNFEYLIINDCSTDNSVSIIKSYNDSRIRFIHNEVNIGLTKSLNKGLVLARGKYIARMDADDWSFQDRFKIQLDFHESKKEAYLSFNTNDEDILITLKKVEQIYKDDYLKLRLLFGNYINHSSAFFLKSSIHYDISYKRTQDYKLWIDFVNYYKFHCHSEKLVEIRIHSKSISYQNKNEQQFAAKLAQEYYFYSLFGTQFDRLFLNRLMNKQDRFNSSDLVVYKKLFSKMKQMLLEKNEFHKESIKLLLNTKWSEITKSAKYENIFVKYRFMKMVKF